MHVASTSFGLPEFRGKTAIIDVPAAAELYVMHGRLAAAATIDQLTAGDIVYATGSIDRSDAAVPVLTARLVLATHVAPDRSADMVLVRRHDRRRRCWRRHRHRDRRTRDARLERQGRDGSLTLSTTSRSVIRTLVAGVVTTETVAALSPGQSIVVFGAVDRGIPGAPLYDIGRAFVW